MKHILLTSGAALLAGTHLALSGFAFYEVLNRNAKVPAKVNAGMKKKSSDNKPSEPKKADERAQWMRSQNFIKYEMTNSRGQKLAGHYLPAEKPTDRFVLGSHGYRNRGKGEFRFITKFYHDNGFNVFLVDHVASGDSEGQYISFGYFESADMLEWVEFMKKEFGDNIQIALHGFSMGSATVTMMSKEKALLPNVRFIVADCGFTNVPEQFTNVLKSYHAPAYLLIATVDLMCRIGQGYSIKKISPLDDVKSAVIPMLFVHGKGDNFVKCDMVYRLYDACPTEKDILTVEGAGHTQSYVKDAAAYEQKLIEFTNKYMKKNTEMEK